MKHLVGAPFWARWLPVAPGMALLQLSMLAFADAPVAPARPWEFIVIHHSATSTGSAETFDAAHRARGMINGLAYHFVIDNGTEGTEDGFIETGPRWIKQMHGGHCRQAYINEHGIGICLVGNFSNGQPTVNQLDSLALLIRGLQDQFRIPDDNILGHGEVIGEFSECPGREFPWEEFRKRLRVVGAPFQARPEASRPEGRSYNTSR
jgi:N-acetylmuramoyl-L-alanine amidase